MPTAISADPTTVANRLRPALLRLNRELRRELHSLGVTGGQVSLLVKIQMEPGIGIRELARWERMSTPGMSKYVARLESAGLVRSSVKRRRTTWLAERLRGLAPGELDAVDAAVEPLLKLLAVEL